MCIREVDDRGLSFCYSRNEKTRKSKEDISIFELREEGMENGVMYVAVLFVLRLQLVVIFYACHSNGYFFTSLFIDTTASSRLRTRSAYIFTGFFVGEFVVLSPEVWGVPSWS